MRLKNTIVFAFLSLSSAYIKGQINNVQNYGFENYTNCSGIGNCTGSAVNNWYEPSGVGGNWYSYPCFGSSATSGVPQNEGGYLFARTGQGYAGINAADTSNEVDYITGTLSDSLKANTKYCVTFYVSLADSEWWAISKIGAYFSNDSICAGNNFNVLNYTPQIENPAPNFLTNKSDWVPVSGEFQANGGEIFITLGDFYKMSLSDFDSVGHGGVIGWYSTVQTYYYIDDVYVRELTIANAGSADTVCLGDSVLIGKDTVTEGVSFHWLPTAGLSNPNIPQPMASPTTTTTYTLIVTNDSILAVNNRGQVCNCADSVTKDSVTISVCTGIKEIKENRNIKVSPNPSNGVFSISGLEKNMRIDIYDYMGRLVNSTVSKTSSMQFNLSNNADGVYLIRIFTKDGEFVGQRKVVKLQR